MELIEEREKTHGPYSKTAKIAQDLKTVVQCAASDSGLIGDAVKMESLEMMCSKMARILVGNHDEADHWKDLAGYAQLVVRELEKKCAKD